MQHKGRGRGDGRGKLGADLAQYQCPTCLAETVCAVAGNGSSPQYEGCCRRCSDPADISSVTAHTITSDKDMRRARLIEAENFS